tara:strand:- start:1171 stop:1320 length:150 start_codon:yes stop_codon:yes gene_type:complete
MKCLATLDSAKIAIIGLGNLELSLAAAVAVAFGVRRGTVGFDIRAYYRA